jgi:hypothetical protein
MPILAAMMPVANATLSAVAMNTVRRPIRSAVQPQKKAPGTAPRPEDSRITADCPYVRCQSLRMNARA